MKKIIAGVLLAFAFSLFTTGLADWLLKQAGNQGEETYAHDVGLPEPSSRLPPPPPPPPPPR